MTPATSAPPRGTRPTRRHETALALVALVVVWELGARLLAGSFVLAAPSEVVVSLVVAPEVVVPEATTVDESVSWVKT